MSEPFVVAGHPALVLSPEFAAAAHHTRQLMHVFYHMFFHQPELAIQDAKWHIDWIREHNGYEFPYLDTLPTPHDSKLLYARGQALETLILLGKLDAQVNVKDPEKGIFDIVLPRDKATVPKEQAILKLRNMADELKKFGMQDPAHRAEGGLLAEINEIYVDELRAEHVAVSTKPDGFLAMALNIAAAANKNKEVAAVGR